MPGRSRREFLAALPVGISVTRGTGFSEIKSGRLNPDSIAVGIGDSDSSKLISGLISGVPQRRTKWTSKGDVNAHVFVLERWTKTASGYRCEIEITGEGQPWGAPISVSIAYSSGPGGRFWTSWDHHPDGSPDKWSDPIVPATLRTIRYSYGGPRFSIPHPGIPWYSWSQRPDGENYFSVPVFTWIENDKSGCSVAISPEPLQLDFEMSLESSGRLTLAWFRHRFASETPVRLAFDIVHHGDDCREGLGWMVDRYPAYFHPPNPAVQSMAGTGAYSVYDGELDAKEMRRMAFSINWRASFDFPYMGMFLPPVPPDVEWTSFRGTPISQTAMESYCRRMKAAGFHVLSYFNVTEFGTDIHYPPMSRDSVSVEQADWHDPNQYLFSNFSNALLRVPSNLPLTNIKWPSGWEQTRDGGLFYTWEKGIGVDPGEPVYSEFLLEQARRHLERIPSSSGFCIDRLDWLRFYNLERDDQVSWFDKAPARSIFWSWLQIMEHLGPLVHRAGKVIFVNPICKRLDALKHVDGLFDEMADDSSALNGVALAGICKPVIVWRDQPVAQAEADSYFQRLLYLGVFPMCPYPQNDHGLDWGTAEGRRPFTDYGALLAAVRGRKWILKAHAFEVEANSAKANLFAVPGGYAAPIVFGTSEEVVLKISRVISDTNNLTCDALHPGIEEPQKIEAQRKEGVLKLRVPLRRGCAMVRIRRSSSL